MFYIHKQLIPVDRNLGDPSWSKRQIWVLKLNAEDTIDSFETIEEAKSKLEAAKSMASDFKSKADSLSSNIPKF